MDQWYVARENARYGPYTAAQLRALATNGQLSATDMLWREGSQNWIAAGTFSELFPAQSTEAPICNATPAGATPAPICPGLRSVDPLTASKTPWFWIATSLIGVGLLVIVPLLIVAGRSSPVAQSAAQTAILQLEEKKKKKDETQQTTKAATQPGQLSSPAEQQRSVAISSPEDPAPSETAQHPLELPPVGPTKAAAGDPVLAKFKKALAAYLGARVEARIDVQQKFLPAFVEIETGNLEDAAKTKARQELKSAANAYFGSGMPLADYTRFLETATRTFGAAAEEALAAYEQRGVTEVEQVRPFLAGRLCARHADLIGSWGEPTVDPVRSSAQWVIDFNERTGGFQVAGRELNCVLYGEKVEFKDGALTFSAMQFHANDGRRMATGVPVRMTVQQGKLRYEVRDFTDSAFNPKRTVAGELRRSLDFGPHLDSGSGLVHILHDLKKAGISSLEHAPRRTVETSLDVADANTVWRRLALFASFGNVTYCQGVIAHEQLYLSLPQSLDLENRTPSLTADQMRQYEALLDSPHPYLKRAALEAFLLSRNRQRLALAAQKYGNIDTSEVKDFDQKRLEADMRYALLREKYREILANESTTRLPFTAQVPLSERPDYQADLQRAMAPDRLQQVVPNGKRVDDLLAYADLAEVDRNAAFWQEYLLPLAKRCSGPKAEQPLVSVTGGWCPNRAISGRGFKRLGAFGLQNVSDQELTHAVVELVAENEWGERAVHFCYLPYLDIGETASLRPHPRWDRHLLDYCTTIKVTWSVWADQGEEVNRQATLTNPFPLPNAADGRKAHLRLDVPDQAEWEALAATMHRTTALPGNNTAQRVLLREASRPGTHYVFRLPEQGKPGRTLVLHFRPGPDVELEIVDPQTNEPFERGTPVWKGQPDPQGGPHLYFDRDGNWEESGWAFSLGLDDQPMIYCPGGGNANALFPSREIPLFLVKSP